MFMQSGVLLPFFLLFAALVLSIVDLMGTARSASTPDVSPVHGSTGVFRSNAVS